MIPEISSLKHKPQIFHEEVGENIVAMFEQMRLIPTLFFVDPWGYKGLSLRLINSVLKNWGCDCIIFFNYNRVNMGLHNQAVEEHMNALFGQERALKLRNELENLLPNQRELTIVEALAEAIKDMGGNYVLPFCFKNRQGNRTSHHLVFVSKNVKGYEIMKEIMAKESSSDEQGVPSFEYNPAAKIHPLLFELSRPLDELEQMLLNDYSEKTLTMREVYNRHHVGKRYIKSNYKSALVNLESKGAIQASPSAEHRPKHKGLLTFGDNVVIKFGTKGSTNG